MPKRNTNGSRAMQAIKVIQAQTGLPNKDQSKCPALQARNAVSVLQDSADMTQAGMECASQSGRSGDSTRQGESPTIDEGQGRGQRYRRGGGCKCGIGQDASGTE
jgi:hypothetical protein